MNKNDIIELTLKLYKLTLLFPKKEPLRYKIREKGDKILENFINWEALYSPAKRDDFLIFEIKKDLEVIKSYFELAKWQNWVSYFDILEIQEKYDKIKKHLSEGVEKLDQELKEEKIKYKPEISQDQISSNSKQRKQKILQILKQKEKIQVWELNKILPDVSKRTLRRDFERLLKQGLVQRLGQGNNTFYKLG